MSHQKNACAARLLSKAALSLVAIALLTLPATAQLFQITNLTSDISSVGVNPTDPDLVNPWGMSLSGGSPWWISDNGTGKSTLYDGNGVKQGLIVTIPSSDGVDVGTPSGTVFNGTSDFQLAPGKPALFLFDTEDGTLSGWNPGVDPTNAVIKVNNGDAAVYKGMTLASANGSNYLYLANFRAGTVEAYDTNFQLHSFGSNAFVDSTIPNGFAPFNIASINGNLIVAYAKQDAERHDDVAGEGNGYIRIFDTQGHLLLRLPHVYQLNSPWGLALAPSGWGNFSGKLLVGQFGSGAIVGYDLARNTFLGTLLDTSALPIRINGLWGLMFGNGGTAGPTTTLYFTAGYFDENHGIFGSIVPQNPFFTNPSPPRKPNTNPSSLNK